MHAADAIFLDGTVKDPASFGITSQRLAPRESSLKVSFSISSLDGSSARYTVAIRNAAKRVKAHAAASPVAACSTLCLARVSQANLRSASPARAATCP